MAKRKSETDDFLGFDFFPELDKIRDSLPDPSKAFPPIDDVFKGFDEALAQMFPSITPSDGGLFFGGTTPVTKNEKLHKLYAELESVMNALKEFVQPHDANQPRRWSQQELANHASLINQRNKIWEEILETESSPD